MPRVTEVKIPAFNEVQDIPDDATLAITGSFARDLASAVVEDHYCTDGHCDITHALDAGAPITAACLLVGATECAHVDAVACAHKFNGTVDPHWPDTYRVADWQVWKDFHDEHGRECDACGSFEYGGADYCSNCLAELGV